MWLLVNAILLIYLTQFGSGAHSKKHYTTSVEEANSDFRCFAFGSNGDSFFIPRKTLNDHVRNGCEALVPPPGCGMGAVCERLINNLGRNRHLPIPYTGRNLWDTKSGDIKMVNIEPPAHMKKHKYFVVFTWKPTVKICTTLGVVRLIPPNRYSKCEEISSDQMSHLPAELTQNMAPNEHYSSSLRKSPSRHDSPNSKRVSSEHGSPNSGRSSSRYESPDSKIASGRYDTSNFERASSRRDSPNSERILSNNNLPHSEITLSGYESHDSKNGIHMHNSFIEKQASRENKFPNSRRTTSRPDTLLLEY